MASTNAAWLNPTNGILLVARLDGPTADIARGLVDKALQAERDGLWGRAYFDARGLPQSETNYWLGDEWILGAAQISRALGFETVVDDNAGYVSGKFSHEPHRALRRLVCGDACGPFHAAEGRVHARRVRVSPALVQRRHAAQRQPSVGAARCSPRARPAPWAACMSRILRSRQTSRCFLERFTVGQFTFGEAAWAAQPALSWQTTVVGDPLYRPFGKSPHGVASGIDGTPQPARRMVLPAPRERWTLARRAASAVIADFD